MKKFGRYYFYFLFLFLTGCAASSYLKGISPAGEKVYLGPVPIKNTEAFQQYQKSAHGEVDKQRYLFDRLKAAKDLQFYRDGNWYNSLEAFRGGMWLMRNRYKQDQDTRQFIKKNIEHSDAGNYHLAKYPDGTLHIGSYVLENELDLLEETAKKTEDKK